MKRRGRGGGGGGGEGVSSSTNEGEAESRAEVSASASATPLGMNMQNLAGKDTADMGTPTSSNVVSTTLEGLGEDFLYNLKLIEERDEELSRSDLEIYKLKVRFAERGAEILNLKEHVETLSSQLSALSKGETKAGSLGEVGEIREAEASTVEGLAGGDRHANTGSQDQYLGLLQKYEALQADYISVKYQLEESKRQHSEIEELSRYGNGNNSDIVTQLTFLKHELECEQHLKHEAIRSLEVETKKNIEVKKNLLKDYESKCLSVMRHLKSVEDSFAEQQRENDYLRVEVGKKDYLESRLLHLAEVVEAAIQPGPHSGDPNGESELTASNLQRHQMKEEAEAFLHEASPAKDPCSGASVKLSESIDEALTSIASAITDQKLRLRNVEMESKRRGELAACAGHRLKASVPLINLAYAYCSAAHKASPAELKKTYSHICEMKSIAKALLRYIKKGQADFVPYSQLDLNVEPLRTEARRLRNQTDVALGVFAPIEEDEE